MAFVVHHLLTQRGKANLGAHAENSMSGYRLQAVTKACPAPPSLQLNKKCFI